MIWHNLNAPSRPDRYLDWEIQARIIPVTEQMSIANAANASRLHELLLAEEWSSVQIEIRDSNSSNANGVLLDNLIWLRNAVRGAQSEVGNFSPKMSSIEFGRLVRHIAKLEQRVGRAETEPVLLPRFFIYLQEDQVYEQGDYRKFTRFGIVFAGPPIPGFKNDIEPVLRNKLFSADTQSVVVGIIDDGIAFAHERFEGRVKRLWIQDVERVDGASEVEIGRVLYDSDIDRIKEEVAKKLGPEADETDVYRHPDVVQIDFAKERHPSIAFRIAHGTHVMDLAAGCDPEDSSDAPQIMAVQLPPAVTEDTSGTKLASYVLNGINAIVEWADELGETVPLVINFSYGFTAGPKDGSQNLEADIDRLVKARLSRGAPTAVVLPAGNSFEDRTVAQVKIKKNGVEELEWVVPPDDETDNYLEVWVDAESEDPISLDDGPPIEITLIPPAEQSIEPPTHTIGKLSYLSFKNRRIAGIYCDKVQSGPTAQSIRYRYMLAINRTKDSSEQVQTAPAGPWKVQLKAARGSTRSYSAKLYIQRDNTPVGYVRRGRQSTFDHPGAHERDMATGDYNSLGSRNICPITGLETLTAIGTGSEVVVVGGIEGDSQCLPADYTASGPVRTKQGPDLSALSDESEVFKGVFASGTRSGSSVTMRGTSVAAPQVTRWIARMMSEGKWTASTSTSNLQAMLHSDTTIEAETKACSFIARDLRLGIGRVKMLRHAELRRRERD